ncbi:protein FAM163A [Danio aesculapii]|uniref:protein FAM163A n=1 Tax=Danio aesculapii TaxID=1142201 RepID=UPI0024BF9DDF|nr:protein FAM163A [Danio aesculapii]
MTAGTVVITGGILAAVILLCIIVVLCYCRLQYYCCKKHGSDPDAVCPQPQLSCGVDEMVFAPLSLSPDSSFCPSCSPYSSTFYIHNGGERLIYLPSQYNNTRAVSTDV